MALSLRTMSALPRQPQLVPSREARVYDGRAGPGTLLTDSGSTAPTVARQATRWGAKAKPPVFDIGWRLCCEHCGCVMDTRSDFADADLHILTFDIPDDALERAADANPPITLVHCTNPLVWECPAVGDGTR